MQTVHHNRLKPCTSSKSHGSPSTLDNANQSESQQLSTNQVADEPLIGAVPNIDPDPHRGRPARNRCPPNRYGNAILDYDNLIP